MSNIEINNDKAVIKLENTTSSAQLLFEISNIVDSNNLVGKKASLLLGNVSLTNSHMFSVKSLIENSGASIELLVTTSPQTQLAGLGAGLVVSDRYIPTEEISDEDTENDDSIFNTIEEELKNTPEPSEKTEEPNDTEEKPKEEIETNKPINETQTEEKAEVKAPAATDETLYIRQTLRSGRTVNFDGNVLVIGDCHPGSEIVAGGDITIWGTLSGIAHAGSKGNKDSKIRALKINAIQLRIADIFSRKPDRLLVEKAEKTATYSPEEARISCGEIIIQPLTTK